MVDFLSITIFPVLMVIAGAGDALSMRIPNWLTLSIGMLFLPMAIATGMPWMDVGVHLLMGLAMFVVGFVIFALGLFGGGDAKLLAAAALWLGWPDLMPFLTMTAFAGGLLALCVGVWALISQNSEIKDGSLFKRFGGVKPNVPYGYAFAIGAILAFPESWWMSVAGA
jgi:prepilin peptidase CpaA